MLLQSTPASCGPTALCNALEALHGRGYGMNPELLEQAAGVNTAVKGLPPLALKRAIARSGHTSTVVRNMLELVGTLALGMPSVILVDKDEHWIAGVGLLGERIVIVDSADGGVARAYAREEFARRWEGRKRATYYAIALTERPR